MEVIGWVISGSFLVGLALGLGLAVALGRR